MSAPRPPRIVQQGPSQAEMQMQQQQMAAYQQQAEQQQLLFRSQLQSQIDEATRQTQEAQQQAMAMANAGSTVMQGNYDITTGQQEATSPQVTETMDQQKQQRSSLRIAPGRTTSTAGTGLNIGV
jgi:hypothetical protein